ncbi:hypothetical protein [Actinacidiphila sp. bgisy167]|uniref:hypothetical protein n=1 Tax=Actinacidiphila sp. bgisy167 TaxID=3413797 RepID=UPI003D753F6B
MRATGLTGVLRPHGTRTLADRRRHEYGIATALLPWARRTGRAPHHGTRRPP